MLVCRILTKCLAFANTTLAATASDWHVETTIGSDHVPIVFTLRGGHRAAVQEAHCWRTDSQSAQRYAKCVKPDIVSWMARVQSRDQAVAPFGDLFEEWRDVTLRAAHASTRRSRRKGRYYRSWPTAKIRRLMTRRRRAQRKYSDVRTAANRATLSYFNARVTQALLDARRHKWTEQHTDSSQHSSTTGSRIRPAQLHRQVR